MTEMLAAASAGQPEQQYRLGMLYFSTGEIASALEWLSRAAEGGVVEASNLLGVIYLNGIGMPCSPQRAIASFSAAAAQDLKEAHYNLSGIYYSGSVLPPDETAAMRHLLRAAELRHPPAMRVLGYLYSLAGGTAFADLAMQCFARAALLGDAHAEYILGKRFLEEAESNTDYAEGLYWLARSADRGVYCARAQLGQIGSSVADMRNATSRTDGLRAAEIASQPLTLPTPSISLRSPPTMPNGHGVWEYSRWIECDLCEYLINLAAPRLSASDVIDPVTGKPLASRLRTSSSMNFQLSMYDMAVGMVCRQLAALTGMDPSWLEPISILRYLPGEEYKPHYDYFSVADQGKTRQKDAAGQRIATILVYLNDVEAGGETEFPRLGVRIRPEQGKAVVFFNCEASGKPDADSLHAGMPVIRGEKWLASLWFRERPFAWL